MQVSLPNRLPRDFRSFNILHWPKPINRRKWHWLRKPGSYSVLEMTLKQMRACVSIMFLSQSTKSTQSESKTQIRMHGERRKVIRKVFAIKMLETWLLTCKINMIQIGFAALCLFGHNAVDIQKFRQERDGMRVKKKVKSDEKQQTCYNWKLFEATLVRRKPRSNLYDS